MSAAKDAAQILSGLSPLARSLTEPGPAVRATMTHFTAAIAELHRAAPGLHALQRKLPSRVGALAAVLGGVFVGAVAGVPGLALVGKVIAVAVGLALLAGGVMMLRSRTVVAAVAGRAPRPDWLEVVASVFGALSEETPAETPASAAVDLRDGALLAGLVGRDRQRVTYRKTRRYATYEHTWCDLSCALEGGGSAHVVLTDHLVTMEKHHAKRGITGRKSKWKSVASVTVSRSRKRFDLGAAEVLDGVRAKQKERSARVRVRRSVARGSQGGKVSPTAVLAAVGQAFVALPPKTTSG